MTWGGFAAFAAVPVAYDTRSDTDAIPLTILGMAVLQIGTEDSGVH